MVWASMINPKFGKTIVDNFVTFQSEVGAYMWSASYADSQRTFDWNVSQSNYNMEQAANYLKLYGK